MKDGFNREIDYVRIAVTDRCNLRCHYCMPPEGLPYQPKSHLLSYEEITRLLSILAKLGFKKVRFTGGEPFLRKDFMQLLRATTALGAFDSVRITSNGTLLQKHLPELKDLGIRDINLSLDSLDPIRNRKITRRNDFETVMETFYALVKNEFRVKINAVIMKEINEEDVLPLTRLAKTNPVAIRFIEEMPFNGGYKKNQRRISALDILQILQTEYPNLLPETQKHGDTAQNYYLPGFAGNIGIIAAFSRTFCTACNRFRIAASGDIKTCLYDNGVFNIKDYIRTGASDAALAQKIAALIRLKPRNGFAAEKMAQQNNMLPQSMSVIGG